MKTCKNQTCSNPVFSKGLCRWCWGREYGRRIKSKTEPTGELELFLRIWETKPHVSELSGAALLPKHHKLWINQFLHVLNKQRFPGHRLNPKNIMLALPQEHEHQDRYPAFEKRKQELLLEIYG